MAVRAKGTTVRQVLSGTVFLNFHHLHPEFQKFILRRIETVYTSKKEVQSDVIFFLLVSVSAKVHSFPFPYLIDSDEIVVTFIFFVAISFINHVCILGSGINCLIQFFQNDREKIVHAFYPLFKTWVQQDYHNLEKLSDLSISIRRCVSINLSTCSQTWFLVFG